MWTITNTGRRFVYDGSKKERIDAVCLEDIAHALSYQCRYNGHAHAFYSTAEHCLHLAEYISNKYAGAEGKERERTQKLAAQALLHDAAEAYVGDMPGPFKAIMPEFDRYEKELMGDIFAKYKLPRKLYVEVKEYDTRILLNEKAALFPKDFDRWEMEEFIQPLEGVQIMCLTPDAIYPVYLRVLRAVFEQ